MFELRLLLEVPAAARACGVVDTGALEAALDAAEASAEHRAILAALDAGDADRAAAAMRYHLRRTAELAGATQV